MTGDIQTKLYQESSHREAVKIPSCQRIRTVVIESRVSVRANNGLERPFPSLYLYSAVSAKENLTYLDCATHIKPDICSCIEIQSTSSSCQDTITSMACLVDVDVDRSLMPN